MKTSCLTLVMIGCVVLIHGTGYAFSSNPAPQEQSAESSTKPLGSGHATDGAPTHAGKGQKNGSVYDGQRTRSHISGKNHPHSRASLTRTSRPKQPRNGRERSTPGNVMNVHQPSSGKSAAGAAKLANRRKLPVRPPGGAALNGRQFKDSRNRGVGPAIISGTANATKGTAAINGTGTNRRHVN